VTNRNYIAVDTLLERRENSITPTNSGKTLIYELAGYLEDGNTTVVIDRINQQSTDNPRAFAPHES
jgi:hypothetical protein